MITQRLKQLNIPQPIFILIIGGFIQSVGNSFMWPLNSIFMHNILGRSLTEAGILLSLQSLATLVGQFISGYLSDRFGSRKVMICGLISAILSLISISISPLWEVYAPCFLLFGFSIAFIFVPLNTLISTLWPEGGRRGFNLLYIFNNAGVAVGTALGGFVASFSFRLIFLLNAFSFSLFLILVLFLLPTQASDPKKISTNTSHQPIYKDAGLPVLISLCVGVLLMWGAYIQTTSIMPVIMTGAGYSLPQYSILWTLNGLFIVTLQPVIHWIIRHWAPTLARQFYLSSLFFGAGFLILLAELPYYSFIIMMLILTLGEMLILPAVPAAAAQIAPLGKSGTYQGIVAGASSGGRVLGPILGGIAFDNSGGSMVWILALTLVGMAFLAFHFYQKTIKSFSEKQKISL